MMDYLAVEYDGEEQARWCGSTAPGSLSYEGPIVLRFHTDRSVTRPGFSLSVVQGMITNHIILSNIKTQQTGFSNIEKI